MNSSQADSGCTPDLLCLDALDVPLKARHRLQAARVQRLCLLSSALLLLDLPAPGSSSCQALLTYDFGTEEP